MLHTRIKKSLGEFAAGTLDETARSSVEAHLVHCQSCREWVAAHGLFSDVLGSPVDSSAQDHPVAADLAAHALATPFSGQLDPAVSSAIDRHLEICATCREEIRLSRQATSMTRGEDEDGVDVEESPAPSTPLRHQLAWAASLAFAVLAATILWISLAGDPVRHEEFAGQSLNGIHVIESHGPMVATDTRIRPHADVTLRGAGTVTLGEGFSVGSGATLVVEIASPDSGESLEHDEPRVNLRETT